MWKFYPSRSPAPAWVAGVVAAFKAAAPEIDSTANHGVTSDAALRVVRPALLQLGFEIEASKAKADKISRPVLFGEAGRPLVSYEVDGFHPEHGVVLEVEAGRGAANNADYRDLIRASPDGGRRLPDSGDDARVHLREDHDSKLRPDARSNRCDLRKRAAEAPA